MEGLEVRCAVQPAARSALSLRLYIEHSRPHHDREDGRRERGGDIFPRLLRVTYHDAVQQLHAPDDRTVALQKDQGARCKQYIARGLSRVHHHRRGERRSHGLRARGRRDIRACGILRRYMDNPACSHELVFHVRIYLLRRL